MLNNDHAAFEAAQSRAAAAVSCESVVLPSGLTVLCRTMPGYSSVHAIYATGFGSIHRAFKLDGRQVTLPAGTAHFLEHKMCETPKGDSFNFYAKTGASANAFTSYDRTCYLFSATQKIDENLDILLGMVGKPWFTKATIAKEQGIIGQEIKMYDDSPDWRLLNALFRCLYADHPLRDDIAGTVESIAELTPELLSRVTRSAGNASSLVPVIMDFVTSLLHQERSEVYMTGQAKLLGQPEYHDIDKAQKMLSALDEDVVSNLPAALSPDSRTQILVGPENVSKELRDTSVVMTKFDIGDGMQGLIGVVGPTRMDYAQITARLSYFAENLSRMFQKNQTPAIEGPENKHNDPEA